MSVLLYCLPLFRVVPLEVAKRHSEQAGFDAPAYVDTLWKGPLRQATRDAIGAVPLVAALRADFSDAAERLGHRLGLGGSVFFLVSGQGRITEVGEDSVEISLVEEGAPPTDGGAPPTVSIPTGPLFGNTLRDSSGLLDVSEFANTRDFNAVAAEMNRRVEEDVLPLLTERAAVGRRLRFVGGVELSDSSPLPDPLVLIPVVVQWR